MQTSRRNVLKGAASVGAIAALHGTGLGALTSAFAADDLRTQILQIPGV
ncbi:MAG: hypothetical protein NUV72_09355, partial [Bauldia sp.]|nr:hypothetical protein [Bauldia sp.]